jgi:acyl-CoA reductase-like NAD-dependent aldehyde dehydrogenase
MAGNCVILKHAAQTLLCAERFSQAFEAADLPAGVFQYLHLDHERTLTTIQQPDINFISFTGSVNAGRIIEKSLGGLFKPLALELGGKDAAYVRFDADIDNAVDCLVDGAFFNSGQSCCGIERIYVDRSVYDDFVNRYVQKTKTLKLGHALEMETSLGPMINDKAIKFAQQHVEQALAQGAKAHIQEQDFPLLKTEKLSQGHYLAPQVLTDVSHTMDLMQEENFSPIVGIMAVESDKQAIELINDSPYGLTASIWSRDEEASLLLCAGINTGTVFVNRCDYLDPSLPWGGVQDSGRGCSLSHLAYQQLTRPKSIHIKNDWIK